jgi:hypothetical protein
MLLLQQRAFLHTQLVELVLGTADKAAAVCDLHAHGLEQHAQKVQSGEHRQVVYQVVARLALAEDDIDPVLDPLVRLHSEGCQQADLGVVRDAGEVDQLRCLGV